MPATAIEPPVLVAPTVGAIAPRDRRRSAWATAALVIAMAAAVGILLPRFAGSTPALATLRSRRLPWLLGVVAAGGGTYLIATVGLMIAAGRRLPIRRTYAAQLAAACTNRVAPAGLGAAATNARYLERSGLRRTEAVAAVTLTATVGFAVHAGTCVVAVALIGGHGPALHLPAIDPFIDRAWPLVAAGGALAAAAGWWAWGRQLHWRALGWIGAAARDLRCAVSQPRRVAGLVATSVLLSGAYVVALAASLRAFGVGLGLGPVAAVYLGGSAVGAVTPAPGGVGAFEASVVTALSAYGVAPGPAVAAVVAYRLITFWLPVAPGAVALRVLRRQAHL